MFGKVTITDENGKLVKPMLNSSVPAEHFAGCVQLFFDLASGGRIIRAAIPAAFSSLRGSSAENFSSMTAITMFVTSFHDHPDFKPEDVVNKPAHPYYAVSKALVGVLNRNVKDAGANLVFADFLQSFSAPGIQKISVEHLRTRRQERLEICGFPEESVPEAFMCQLSVNVMDTPAYMSNLNARCEAGFLRRCIDEKGRDPFTNSPATESNMKFDEGLGQQIELFVRKVELVYALLGYKVAIKRYPEFVSAITDENVSIDTMRLIMQADQASALYENALESFKEGRYKDAVMAFSIARDGFKFANNPIAEASCCYNIASCYMRLLEHKLAREACRQSLALRQSCLPDTHVSIARSKAKLCEVKRHKLACRAFYKANDLFRDGEYQSALDLYKEAVSLHPLNDERRALYCYNLGSCYDRLGDVKNAIEQTKNALDLRRSILGDEDAGVKKTEEKLRMLEDKLAAQPISGPSL